MLPISAMGWLQQPCKSSAIWLQKARSSNSKQPMYSDPSCSMYGKHFSADEIFDGTTRRKIPISPLGWFFSEPSIQVQTGGQLWSPWCCMSGWSLSIIGKLPLFELPRHHLQLVKAGACHPQSIFAQIGHLFVLPLLPAYRSAGLWKVCFPLVYHRNTIQKVEASNHRKIATLRREYDDPCNRCPFDFFPFFPYFELGSELTTIIPGRRNSQANKGKQSPHDE